MNNLPTKWAEQEKPSFIYSVAKRQAWQPDSCGQLSPEFTGAIVDRWIELEEQVKQSANESTYKLPTTYLEALEQLVEKEKKLLAAQPKANYYDMVVERSTLLNATEVANKIGLTAQRLKSC